MKRFSIFLSSISIVLLMNACTEKKSSGGQMHDEKQSHQASGSGDHDHKDHGEHKGHDHKGDVSHKDHDEHKNHSHENEDSHEGHEHEDHSSHKGHDEHKGHDHKGDDSHRDHDEPKGHNHENEASHEDSHEDHSSHKDHDEHEDDHGSHDNHSSHAGHDHGGGKAIGEGKAILEVDEKKGLKLSPKAIDTLGLEIEPVPKDSLIGKESLVVVKDQAGVYIFDHEYFKHVPVKILSEGRGNKVKVSSPALKGKRYVVSAVNLLRVADIYSTDTAEYGHSH